MDPTVEPDDIAFGIDPVSMRVARQMGYRGDAEFTTQDYVRLPEFGQRKVAPDSIEADIPTYDAEGGDWFLYSGETFNRIHIFGDHRPR